MASPQLTPWFKGIVFRSLAAVTLITVLLGGLSSLVIREQVATRGHGEALQRLSELLDAVESTASVAIFANDEQLAREVVQGLLRNSEVQRVTISAGPTVLARAERSATQFANQPPVDRVLRSPFKKAEVIGGISLDANWDAIYKRVDDNSRYALLMLLSQLLLVIVGTAGMVFLVVVRPIKATSDRMHRHDPVNGGALAIPEGHAGTEIGRLVGDINDLTGRLVSTLNQERELRRQHEIAQRKYQNLFDHASSGIFVADIDGRLASFNPAFISLTWLSRTVAEEPRRLIEAGWSEGAQLIDLLHRCAQTQLPCADDFLLRGRRGDERWLHVAVMPLGDGSMQGTITDVTTRKREEMTARRLAVTDPLTGFFNRQGLLQAFSTVDADTPPFAIVMIDLDGFKLVNDAMGFPVGDQVLLKVAKRIRATVQPDDYLARTGGDDFVLILAGADAREALAPRIEAMHALLCEHYAVGRESVLIGASIGVAFFPQDGADMPQLLRSAELALNSAREASRSVGTTGYRFFDQQLQMVVEHRRRLEDDLRLAVNGGELCLAFQPIIDLRTGCMAGAEALLRWQHPARGFISPEIFIPLAERVGLIGEIGRQVLEGACMHAAAWRRDGFEMYVSVNVSASQIPDDLPPAVVLDALRRHDLPPHAIAIEITEGVLMNDIDIAQRWIEELRACGLCIFLDDFGTGYSSLSYLKRFAMDTVKIDKSFIMDMSADNSDRTLVEAIITMAGSLGLKVVAEGVEDAGQLALLREMGCAYGQGYLFSRAVAAVDFASTVARISAEMAIDLPNLLPDELEIV